MPVRSAAVTRREINLAEMRAAGYHNDQRIRVQLLVGARIKRETLEEEFAKGERAKRLGVACTCMECKSCPR
jgi:hypothetical protein